MLDCSLDTLRRSSTVDPGDLMLSPSEGTPAAIPYNVRNLAILAAACSFNDCTQRCQQTANTQRGRNKNQPARASWTIFWSGLFQPTMTLLRFRLLPLAAQLLIVSIPMKHQEYHEMQPKLACADRCQRPMQQQATKLSRQQSLRDDNGQGACCCPSDQVTRTGTNKSQYTKSEIGQSRTNGKWSLTDSWGAELLRAAWRLIASCNCCIASARIFAS